MNQIKFYNGIEHKNWLITIAIGDKYLEKFESFSLPLVEEYSKINNVGLACIYKDIDDSYPTEIKGKKKTWQKFLVPNEISKYSDFAENVCYFDSDILFNPYGKNIFNFHIENKISLVSEVFNLPGNLLIAQKIISYSRNKYYSNTYPLDSAIFMKVKDYYNYHGFEEFDDIACAGLFVANIRNHAEKLEKIFCKYKNSVESITDGGDEPAFNYEIRSSMEINNLPYEFQAIWNYEMAWHYRHLYKKLDSIDQTVIDSVCSCLLNQTALHFAGSWHESKLYCDKKISDLILSKELKKYINYQNEIPKGNAVGRKVP